MWNKWGKWHIFEYNIHNIKGSEQVVWKLAKVLSVENYQKDYDVLYALLEEYPLLQYRMENFSKKIFVDSKSVYEELIRHKQKVRWQVIKNVVKEAIADMERKSDNLLEEK